MRYFAVCFSNERAAYIVNEGFMDSECVPDERKF